ncbi:MAG TPA: sugar ABC transporter permease, partial [Anaerolineales bacterium]|nr:sugar ABC transporter permease [Anaerolineales bacterium]
MKIRNDFFAPYMFLLPAMALLIIFNLIPAIATLNQSLYKVSPIRGVDQVFVGFENFTRIFLDPVFWKSVRVTLLFALIVNPLQTIFALALALIANQRAAGINVFRSIFLIPVAVSINITVVVWGLMVDPDAGLLNGILHILHLPELAFLTSPAQALYTIIMIISWKGI